MAFRPLLTGVRQARTPAGIIPRDQKEHRYGPRAVRTHRQCRQARDQVDQGGKKLAIISLATSERWKADGGDAQEKTFWHRVAVFAPAKVDLIEAAVHKGTRLRLVGQIRPGAWEDERGQTRSSVEFVVTGFGEVEILARGKPKASAESEAAPAPRRLSESEARTRRLMAGPAGKPPALLRFSNTSNKAGRHDCQREYAITL